MGQTKRKGLENYPDINRDISAEKQCGSATKMKYSKIKNCLQLKKSLKNKNIITVVEKEEF